MAAGNSGGQDRVKSGNFNEDQPPSVIRVLHVIEQTEARLGDTERLMAEQRQAFEKLAQGYADLKAQIADLKRENFFDALETHAQEGPPFGFLPEEFPAAGEPGTGAGETH